MPEVKGVSLNAITVLSPKDIWAVGEYHGGNTLGAILHWDGSKWNTLIGANAADGGLHGVTALSANNVWAVGYKSDGPYRKPIIRHWDGSKWSDVTSPKPMSQTGFNAISKDSSGSIWVAGMTFDGPDKPIYGVVAHVNGVPCSETAANITINR